MIANLHSAEPILCCKMLNTYVSQKNLNIQWSVDHMHLLGSSGNVDNQTMHKNIQ